MEEQRKITAGEAGSKDLKNVLPVEAAKAYIFDQPVETHGRSCRNLEGGYEK
jgi:hypothetical protein